MAWRDDNPPNFWEFSMLKVDGLGMMEGWTKLIYRAGSLGYEDPRMFAKHVLNRDTYHLMGVRTYVP